VVEKDEEWLTVAEIVAMLKVHEQTVRRWIREDELPAIELGRRSGYRIRRRDFERFLEGRSTTGKAAA
jgi:excisionase family DNA binding protein